MAKQTGKPVIRKKPPASCSGRKWLQLAKMLLLSCGILWGSLWVLFLLARGPAYIYFAEVPSENGLAALHSQCIQLDAQSAAADITGSTYLDTGIRGTQLLLSSDALSGWIAEQVPLSDWEDGCLLLESKEPFEIKVQFENSEGTLRCMFQDSQDIRVDPALSDALYAACQQLQIYPQVSGGEAFESFAAVPQRISIHVPDTAKAQILFVPGSGKTQRLSIDPGQLPDHRAEKDDSWSFAVSDTDIQIDTAGKDPLELSVSGRYALRLSCIAAGQIRGYLTGDLVFENTNDPKSYDLIHQLVEIGSKDRELVVDMTRDLRMEPEAENTLLISGNATRMDISGIDPFPDFLMWFRKNSYTAPLSVISVIISICTLYPRTGKQTVKPRRVR